MKVYLDKDVFTATQERLEFIFNNFERIYVSFSGGKDSGVLLNMCIDIARKLGRKFGVMFIDLEAYYKMTIEFVEAMFKENQDVIEPMWICLPMESPNSLSYLDPTWIWWDQSKKDIWVREMPKNKWVINESNNTIDFYRKNMPFESFIKYFGNWYGGGTQKVACLVGIRTDESLNRYRSITLKKEKFQGKIYSTRVNENTYNFYPLYDWRADDIWKYNGKFNKKYNKLYDLFYKAGVSIYRMRVDEPFGNEAKAGLNLFKVVEPETWGKVVNRVSGANFGNIYDKKKIMSIAYTLPKNHTWKTFTKFLLGTLPKDIAIHYRAKFYKFIRYWMRVGSPVRPHFLKIFENNYSDYIINTHCFSTRGTGDKEVMRFKKIPDEIPELDTKGDFLSWKKLAMCIIKNDFVCRTLSFSYTKDVSLRQKQLIEKYKNL